MAGIYRGAGADGVFHGATGDLDVRRSLRFILLAGMAAGATVAASALVGHAQAPAQAAPRGAVRLAASSAPAAPRQKPVSRTSSSKQQLVAPAKTLSRPEFTAADQLAARLPGWPAEIRFWGDSVPDFQRALPLQPGPWLILSSGGADGAYGAGFLNGWASTGTRPEFSVVTGVSTGALMATYVFAGGSYDEALHQVYTTVTAADVFEVAQTPESLIDNWPLGKTIDQHVTPELLSAIAAEHRRGRRLFIVTSNLDAGRPTVWNMGAIAEQGGEAALKLYRQVLLAATSVEGFFPPVYITVEANGRQFQEMHADGGANGPLFFGPEAYLVPETSLRFAATGLYSVFNGRLLNEFSLSSRTLAGISGRTMGVALKLGGRLQLALAGVAARNAGIPFELTYVDEGFTDATNAIFDPKYMSALYAYGLARGRSDDRFHKGPPTPGVAASTPSTMAK